MSYFKKNKNKLMTGLFLIGIGLSLFYLLKQPTDKNVEYVLPKAETNESQKVKEPNENHDLILGGLAIPSIDKTLKIYDSGEEPYITIGVGMDVANRVLGRDNVILASHDAPETFGRLIEIQVGDKLYTTDETNVYTFVVTSHFEAIDDNVQDIKRVRENQNQPILTLYTCLGGYGTNVRTVVQATLEEQTELSDAPKEVLELFSVKG